MEKNRKWKPVESSRAARRRKSVFAYEKENKVKRYCEIQILKMQREKERGEKKGRRFPSPKGRLTQAERVRALSIKGL